MAKRKRQQQYYEYECTLSGEKFRRYRKVDDTSELVSVKAYYELHPEQDDRPHEIKAQIAQEEEDKKKMEDMLGLFES